MGIGGGRSGMIGWMPSFLARQGRADVALLHPIQHRGAGVQRDLAVLRSRDQLVQVRTALINHVRGAVKSTGGRLRRGSSTAFAGAAQRQLDAALLPALGPVLEQIDALTQRIAGYDRTIAQRGASDPAVARLQQVPGVGVATALAFVRLIDDPSRFRRSRDVGAYFGLVPRWDESSGSQPQLRISKAGDAFGRRLLVTAAPYILGPFGPPSDLRRHGETLARRGGTNAKKAGGGRGGTEARGAPAPVVADGRPVRSGSPAAAAGPRRGTVTRRDGPASKPRSW
jgi:hypothetical protein